METQTLMQVLLADDRGLVRDAVAAYIGTETRYTVAVCDDYTATLASLRSVLHDVVLVADTLPGLQGADGLARLVAARPAVPVILIATQTTGDPQQMARLAGLRGCVAKSSSGGQLVDAILALAGGVALPEDAEAPDPQAAVAQMAALTRRETDVLQGLCEGKTNKEIARDLELQEVTVKLHVKTMSRKLGARNRTHAAMIARNAGLI
jgi:DNA-binding NarL/FixJ family response regulator